MKKLLTVVALLFIGSATFASNYCVREYTVYENIVDTHPYMGNARGSDNNKNMFDWMRKNQIVVWKSIDRLYINKREENPPQLKRVFLSVNGMSVGELVDVDAYINTRSVELYYNGQKNKRKIDLHDYMNKEGVYTVGFVGVEVPLSYVYLIDYK